MLSSSGLVARLRSSNRSPDSISIVPSPDLTEMERVGAASVDLRLGRWFRTLRQSRTNLMLLHKDSMGIDAPEPIFTKEHFVRFGDRFVLHPGNFVLGITLEWLRLAPDVGGYVTGKSSLGRRGLVIETAAGIQPGFSGCLALEISNVGEVPIALVPGMKVCQVFLHVVQPSAAHARTQFGGRRKPVLGKLPVDPILDKLAAT